MFLSDYDEKLQKLNTKSTLAAWNYYTNLTDENEKINNEASLEVSILWYQILFTFYIYCYYQIPFYNKLL